MFAFIAYSGRGVKLCLPPRGCAKAVCSIIRGRCFASHYYTIVQSFTNDADGAAGGVRQLIARPIAAARLASHATICDHFTR